MRRYSVWFRLIETKEMTCRSGLLIADAEELGGPVGGGGRCERISALNTESAFPRVEMNASTSYNTFFRNVENDTKINLLLEI
jgi:hypothetical protein